jgi:hypothetical protein
MSQYKIGVVVGSLRKDSFNRKLATGLVKLGPADFTFHDITIGDLPLYNQDHDADQAPAVKRMKAEIAGSQGLLFVTPEYNRSMSGVLKNALDHGSRPYGQSAWGGKPAGVIGASVGAVGTLLNNTCAMCWPFSTCRRSASRKPSSRPRTACSKPTAASVPAAAHSYKAGWTATSPG